MVLNQCTREGWRARLGRGVPRSGVGSIGWALYNPIVDSHEGVFEGVADVGDRPSDADGDQGRVGEPERGLRGELGGFE